VSQIHQVKQPQLLVAVDHEGGRVQRFRLGFSHIPSARWIGENYQSQPEKVLNNAAILGWLMASELRAVGVDFSFAPILDLGNDTSRVIGDRAFHSDPEAIFAIANATMNGIHQAGMATVGKHFPGHGHVVEDSHFELPVDHRSLQSLLDCDLIPFVKMINNGIDALMPAHVIYEQIDQQPAGFSRRWLKDILRKQLGFNGVIFSDDLNMAAASMGGSFSTRTTLALDSGCDMALVCNNSAGLDEVLDQMTLVKNSSSSRRLEKMQAKKTMATKEIVRHPQWAEAMTLIEKYQENS
jgi:beta-N-acetylhexosaminidase